MTTLARRRAPSTEEETEPTSRRSGRRGSASRSQTTSSSSGWGSYDEKRRNSSSFSQKFKPVEDTEYLIKFVDPEPVAVYLQHWINEADKGEKNSYTCYLDGKGDPEADEDCPMDSIGDKATTQTLFNVINCGPAEKKKKPVVEVWHITAVTVADRLKRLSEARRSSPLNREDLYFIVKANKQARKTTWDIDPIKAEDLADAGWDMEPFTAKELGEWAKDGISAVDEFTHVDTREELLAAIDKYNL